MSEISASSDAHRFASVADLLGRLPEQLRNSPIFEQLALADEEAEANRLSCALREARQPELKGLGTSFRPAIMPVADDPAISDRAQAAAERSEPTVQRVSLHDANSPSGDNSDDRAVISESRCFLGLDGSVGASACSSESAEIVQALSVKNSENNGCTVGSLSPQESASPAASRDNFFASPPPARLAHEGNEPCTAPAPPSPVQEISACAPRCSAADFEEQPAEAPLAEFDLGYCRCDFFDNGSASSAKSTKSGRARARFKINVFIGQSSRSHTALRIAFPSEARFFKRSIPTGHAAFYNKVWGRFEGLRRAVRNERIAMEIDPIVAHVKTRKNHIIPRAAAILLKAEGEPADVILFLDGSVFPIELHQKAKGSAKCAALKALGYWNAEK